MTKVSERDDQRVRLEAGSTTVEVAALAPDLFWVRTFPEGCSKVLSLETGLHRYLAYILRQRHHELPAVAVPELRRAERYVIPWGAW